MPFLEGKNVLDPDSARYLRQAKLIIEKGTLPDHDSMRWVPAGVDINARLTLFPYILAYAYRLFTFLGLPVTIEKLAIFSPIFFSVACVFFLYLLISEVLDRHTALLSINASAVSLPWVARTVSGYSDRDGLCLLFTLASYYFYVRSYHANRLRNSLFFAMVSGIIAALLGLTWEGSGLCFLPIILMEFVQLTFFRYEEKNIYRIFCWVIPIVIALSIVKNVYRDLSQPFAFIALGLPCSLLILASSHFAIIRSSKLSRIINKTASIVIRMLLVVCAILSVFLISSFLSSRGLLNTILGLWDNFVSPLGQSRLFSFIGELQKQGTTGWILWPGLFFIFIAVGLFMLAKRFATALNLNVSIFIVLFEILLGGAVLTRILSGWNIGRETSTTLAFYTGSVIIFFIGMGICCYIAYRKTNESHSVVLDKNALFLLLWFTITLLVARGGLRFDFFFVPIAVATGSYAFIRMLQTLVNKAKLNQLIFSTMFMLLSWELYGLGTDILTFPLFLMGYVIHSWIRLFITIISTILFSSVAFIGIYSPHREKRVLRLFLVGSLVALLILLIGPTSFTWLNGYTAASYAQASQIRPLLANPMYQAFKWINYQLPPNAIIAASWEYGSFLNLMANRATIIDEEQLQYWVYLMNRHVMMGQSELEALKFLKAHKADYLVFTLRDIDLLPIISVIGSNESFDRRCDIHRFGGHIETILSNSGEVVYRYLIPGAKAKADENLQLKGKNYSPNDWRISSIYLSVQQTQKGTYNLQAALVELDIGNDVIRLPPEEIYFNGHWIRPKGNTIPCTILVHQLSSDPTEWDVIYLSKRVRNSLMVKLFLLNKPSPYFTPVHPPEPVPGKTPIPDYSVRIWKINYPPDLKPDPKYLLTDFPDPILREAWMRGKGL